MVEYDWDRQQQQQHVVGSQLPEFWKHVLFGVVLHCVGQPSSEVSEQGKQQVVVLLTEDGWDVKWGTTGVPRKEVVEEDGGGQVRTRDSREQRR